MITAAVVIVLLAVLVAAVAASPLPHGQYSEEQIKAIIADFEGVTDKDIIRQLIAKHNLTDKASAAAGRKKVSAGCPTLITAHRGATYSLETWAPENTFASTEEAVHFGSEIVETDIRVTMDGVYVFLHDGTLDRTTNCTGEVTRLTYDYIRNNCEAGPYPWWQGPIQHVPTVEEGLSWARNFSIQYDFDTKTTEVEGALDVVVAMGMEDYVFVTSGNVDTVRRSRAHAPAVRIMAKSSSVADTEAMLALFNPAPQLFEIDTEGFTPENVELIHSVGAQVFMNSLGVRDVFAVLGFRDMWARMIDGGVDIIQTDFPGLLREFIDDYCASRAI